MNEITTIIIALEITAGLFGLGYIMGYYMIEPKLSSFCRWYLGQR